MRRRARILGRSVTSVVLAGIAVAGLPTRAPGQCATPPPGYTKGKISRTFYRIPYADISPVTAINDYSTHNGGFDMRAPGGGGVYRGCRRRCRL